MFVYSSRFVEVERVKGFTGLRPLGADQAETWSVLKLSDTHGELLLGTQNEIASPPAGCELLVADRTERLSAAAIAKLSNAIGENLDSARHRDLSVLVLDLLGDTRGGKRTALKPQRDGRTVVWLGGEKVVDLATIRGGGVEVTDDFNRANSDTIGGSWTEYTDDGNKWDILSNQLRHKTAVTSADAFLRWEANLSSADHYAQVDVVAVGSDYDTGPMVRFSSAAWTGYGGTIANWSGNIYTIIEVTAAVWAELAETSRSDAAAGTYKFTASGSSLELFRNGVSKLTATDSTLTNLRSGIYGWNNGGGSGSDAFTLDNFEAGSLAAGGSAVALTGRGAISSAGRAGVLRAAALAGHGDAATTGRAGLVRSAALAGHGDASSAGRGAALLGASLAGHGDASANGEADALLGAALSGHGDNAAGSQASALLAADLRGHGDAATAGTGAALLGAALTGHGDACSAGTGDLTVTGAGGSAIALTGSGAAASNGTGLLGITADLAGHGDVSAPGTSVVLQVVCALAGHGDAASSGTVPVVVLCALAGFGAAAGTGSTTLQLLLALAGHGDAASTGSGPLTVTPEVTDDPYPLTLTLRDRDHAIRIDDDGHTATLRDRGHTATLQEQR